METTRINIVDIDWYASTMVIITFVGHCLATKVFIGKLPATRGVRVIGWANDDRVSWASKIVCKTLIGVYLTTHLMYPIKVLHSLLHTNMKGQS